MAEKAHSLFSASGADRWMQCAGSLVMEQDRTGAPSIYAAAGTVAHALLEDNLKTGADPADRIGDVIEQDGFEIEVDDDMAERVQTAADNIRELTVGNVMFLCETQVNYAGYLGVPADDGYGTLDAGAVMAGGELQVHDFKDGHRAVDAEDSRQMRLYAGGLLAMVDDVLDEPITMVRMFIHQPRVAKEPNEWRITRAELEEWLKGEARSRAASAINAKKMVGRISVDDWRDTFIKPGEKQCQYCKAKATCVPRQQALGAAVFGVTPASPAEFEAAEPVSPAGLHATHAWIAAALAQVDSIEAWCEAVRGEALQRLQTGADVPGYKLVQGKRGARAWRDPSEAEELLKKQFRLTTEQAYNLKLKSPTQVEKLVKEEVVGPRQWKKAQELIVQPDGKLHVAPVSDQRPAVSVTPVADDFQPVVEDDIT